MAGEAGSPASPRVEQMPSWAAVSSSLLVAGLPVALGEGRVMVWAGPPSHRPVVGCLAPCDSSGPGWASLLPPGAGGFAALSILHPGRWSGHGAHAHLQLLLLCRGP